MTNQTGTAYAFFDCGASKEKIEGEFPAIRGGVQTPEQLELLLTEDVSELKLDTNLSKIARDTGRKYTLVATQPNATNEATASELGDILNQAYLSPLYEDNEPFNGDVVYEENERYVFRNKE